jgi:hypothetical protein
MNLFWAVFSGGDNTLGGVTSNVFYTITLVLIITLTVIYKKRKAEPLEITNLTIWMKTKEQGKAEA